VSGVARKINDPNTDANHVEGRSREPMSDPTATDNNQLFDLASGLDTLALGVSTSESFAVLGAVMAQTLGMAMYNAVSAQQNASTVRAATVTMACAEMLSLSIARLDKPAGDGAAKPSAEASGPASVQETPAASVSSSAAAKGQSDGSSGQSDANDGTTVDARILDAVNQIQSAVMQQQVVLTSGAGKAYQSVAHSAAIAVQDAADAMRGISIIAATASGVAMTKFLANGDPKYLAAVAAAQDMIKLGTDEFARAAAVAAAAVKDFPSG
jgi:hypothetical protein